MKVQVLDGQEDISKPNLGDLHTMYDKAMVAFQKADEEYRLADRARENARYAVTEAQKKLSAAFALLKQDAPRATPWADAP